MGALRPVSDDKLRQSKILRHFNKGALRPASDDKLEQFVIVRTSNVVVSMLSSEVIVLLF